MQFNIHEAKTQFSKLVAAVERGERVVICRSGKPVIECIPIEAKSDFPFGVLGPPPRQLDDDQHLVGPTDDALLDEMGL